MAIHKDRVTHNWAEGINSARIIVDGLAGYGRHITSLVIQFHKDDIVMRVPFDGEFTIAQLRYVNHKNEDPFLMLMGHIAIGNPKIKRWEFVTAD